MSDKVTWHDLEILAKTIWGEARGETQLGREAVAHVIVNRWRADFGQWKRDDTITGTCLRAAQFSAWNLGDPNRAKIEQATPATPLFLECLAAGLTALTRTQNPLPDVYHYKVAKLPWPASWGPEQEPVRTIGRHAFFEGID